MEREGFSVDGVLGHLSSLAGLGNAATIMTTSGPATAMPKAKAHRQEGAFQEGRASAVLQGWAFRSGK